MLPQQEADYIEKMSIYLKFLYQIGCLRIFIRHFLQTIYIERAVLLNLEEHEGRYLKTQHANVKASRSNLKY